MVYVSASMIVNALVNGVVEGLIYGLAAAGLALIWGVLNIINFAQGEYLMLGAYVAVVAYLLGLDPLWAIPLAFAAVFVAGIATYVGAIRRILRAPFLVQIAVTFALLLLIRYGVELVAGPYTWQVKSVVTGVVASLGFVRIPVTELLAAVGSAATFLLLHLLLTRTYLGLAARAVAQDRDAAELQGVDVDKVYMLVFALGVAISGVGGALIALHQPVFPEMGAFYTLIAFIAVVLGGFTSIMGTFAAAIFLGVIEELSAIFISPELKHAVAFLVFILVLLLRPQGFRARGVRVA